MSDLLDRILTDAAKPAVESAYFLRDKGLLADYERLQAELRAALRRQGDTIGSAEVAALRKQVAEAEEALGAALAEFRFKSIGFQAWTKLARKYPPQEGQKAQGHDTDPDRHRPAALAACCIEPEGADVAFFMKLAASEGCTNSDFEALWVACFKANYSTSNLPKAMAARLGLTRGSSARSETSASETDEQSPPASSSDE